MKLAYLIKKLIGKLVIFVILFSVVSCTKKEAPITIDEPIYEITTVKENNIQIKKFENSSFNNIDLDTIKIGYSSPSLNAPYYKALLSCIQETAENSGMKFLFGNGEDDIRKQVTATEELINQGIHILLLNPLDPKGLIETTKLAKEKNIPVFIVDSSIDESAEYVTTIQCNNRKNGELVGAWLVQQMKDTEMNIALLSGAPGNPVGMDRTQGFLNGIAKEQLSTLGYIDLNIKTQAYTNWTYSGGQKAIEDILIRYPEINVIAAESDVCVLGAMDSIRREGKLNDILIVSIADGQKEALKYIKETEFYGATGMNNPEVIGKKAIEYALEYLNGKRNFSKTMLTPELLITKSNVDEIYDPNSYF